jgi:cysteine desulfurase
MSVYEKIYLDANSTTKPRPEVISAMVEVMCSAAANPASAHAAGALARRIVEEARDSVSEFVGGADPENTVFVSGGTEANNLVLRPFAANKSWSCLVAPVEHPSVLKPLAAADADGRLHWLRVDHCGLIDPDDVARQTALCNGNVVLALQAANSETGVVQPVAAIVKALRSASAKAFVLLDAAQAAGRIPISLSELDVDAISFSGHKLHGPSGTGVLVVRDGATSQLSPLLLGGGQERGLRSGTLNVPAIAGLSVALRLRNEAFGKEVGRLASMRDLFEARLYSRLGNRVSVNGGSAARVANTSNLRFQDVDGMRLLALLDGRGVMASQGSACSSGRPEPSSTLTAMGLSQEEAFGSLRFSFSIYNTLEEATSAAETTVSLVQDIAA